MTDRNRADGDRYGTVEKDDEGRTLVRFERLVPYSIERVWSAITEPEELARWIPGIEFECREGGTYQIWFGGNCEGPPHISGIVEAFQPPNVLQLGTIRWELSATESGCRLQFSDVLHFAGPRTRREFADSVLGGWHQYLDWLEDSLAGRAIDSDEPEPDYSIREVAGRPS